MHDTGIAGDAFHRRVAISDLNAAAVVGMTWVMPPAPRLLLLLALCGGVPGAEAGWRVVPPPQSPAQAPWVVALPDEADRYATGARAWDATGRELGAAVLWASAGEPVLVACPPGVAPVTIAPGSGGPAFTLAAGILTESRHRVDGPADTLAQARALWNRCTPVQGRTLLPNIFLGINPCGETRDFACDSIGFFRVDAPGTYRFATLSDDASFLLIDDQPLVAWGGWHGLDGGWHGEHGAAIALSAGVHRLEYLYVQNGDNPIQEVAWSTPSHPAPAVMPPESFLPVVHARVAGRSDGGPWWSWEIRGSSVIEGAALAVVELVAHDAGGCRWQLPDGTVVEGDACTHAFAGSGPRTISLVCAQGPPLRRTIAVHPCWSQVDEWSDAWTERARAQFLAQDVLAMPPADVLVQVAYAAAIPDRGWIAHIGEAVASAPQRVGREGAPLLARLGFELQHAEIRHYEQAHACFQALLALIPGHDPLREHVALHDAGLLINGFDRAADGLAQLATIDPHLLAGADPRLLLLYRGDGALGQGDADGARACYRQAGDVVDAKDLGYTLRRRLRLEQARSCLARREWEQALDLMREIEWETPLERLGPETGLIKAAAYLGRGEVPFARACCRHLLTALPVDASRAEVLLALIRTDLAGHDRGEAVDAGRRLVADFPYSEAAARAKDILPEITR